MSNTVKLILNSPSDGWLLVQAGFKVRAKKWLEFHTPKRFIIYVYDVLPISRVDLSEITQKDLDPDDTIWEDPETGTILIVKNNDAPASPKFQVLSK
jgi:hypothetical protein